MLGFFKKMFEGGDSNELQQYIKDRAFLVDVRTPEEFELGSAEGAVNIPLNEVNNKLSEFKSKDKIVVFCKSGVRSGQAKSILENNGIENVINGGSYQSVIQAVEIHKNDGSN